jgi:anti-anti-sigma regulatory factor
MRVGRFTFSSAASRWSWSDEMFALHGMAPGDVVPTRALFLSHVHPEDRARVVEVLDGGDAPDGCAYRLIDLAGTEHDVLVAAARTGAGEQVVVEGFVVDDSPRQGRAVAAAVNDQLKVALESHAVIDQAKGMLMMVYGLDDLAAFDLLRSASQQRNVRLRVLAERLVGSAQARGGMGSGARTAMDDLFLSSVNDSREAQPPVRATGHIELDDLPSGPCLRVHGQVDAASMAELTTGLSKLLAVGRTRGRVLVDLTDVPRVGAAAQDVLRAAQRRCIARDITMEIIGAGAEPHARELQAGVVPRPPARSDRRLGAGRS